MIQAEIARVATCRCGEPRVTCIGEPVRVPVCHCLAYQKRSGIAFAVEARWPNELVDLTGDVREHEQAGGSGTSATFNFCPRCGATVAFTSAGVPSVTAVLVGEFADPSLPSPQFSVYEKRKHRWAAVLGNEVERWD